MDVKPKLAAALAIIAMALTTSIQAQAQPQLRIGEIPSAIPQQQSVTIFHGNGDISVGTINRDTGSLFLSGPGNQITIGNEDQQGNIVIQEYGGENDDD
jgi:hypothetical protein